MEIYKEGKYFREKMKGYLRRLIVTDRQIDSSMPNWEPAEYFSKGVLLPTLQGGIHTLQQTSPGDR